MKSDKAGEMLSGFGAEMKSEVGGSHFRFVKLAGNYCYYGEIGGKRYMWLFVYVTLYIRCMIIVLAKYS